MTSPFPRAGLGLALILALNVPLAAATPVPEVLTLFDGQPQPGLQVTVADMEAELPWRGQALTVPKPAQPRVPASRLSARPLPLDSDGAQGIALDWQDVWLASMRIDAERPRDLRPYLERGTLEFEVRSPDLSRSGLNVGMDCGPGCGRQINHVLASRALAGRGWQRLSFPLRCFVRDGADFSQVKRLFSLDSSGTAQVDVAGVRILREGTPNVSCPDHRSQSVTPEPLQEVWSVDWWLPRHEKKLADVRAAVAAGQAPRLVFIGDSITQGWENEGREVWAQRIAPFGALALGFGGDRTENVLWRLQHGEIDGFQARAVVLMIGTNNTGHRQEDPATTAAGVQRLLQEIQARQPQATVLLLAVFPRGKRPDDKLRLINNRLNTHLAQLADGQRVLFQDLNAALMNADGTLDEAVLPDLLHLSERGYDLWAAQIAPTLQRLLAR